MLVYDISDISQIKGPTVASSAASSIIQVPAIGPIYAQPVHMMPQPVVPPASSYYTQSVLPQVAPAVPYYGPSGYSYTQPIAPPSYTLPYYSSPEDLPYCDDTYQSQCSPEENFPSEGDDDQLVSKQPVVLTPLPVMVQPATSASPGAQSKVAPVKILAASTSVPDYIYVGGALLALGIFFILCKE